MAISGHTRLYCLIGDPVAGSLSPFIMNRAFAERGIDAVYVALPVSPPHVPAALTGLRTLDVAGANVTYPLKEAVLAGIDCAERRVAILGAANTLQFTADGCRGFNTDAAGTVLALAEFGGVDLSGADLVIVGAGGSGRAAALGALEAGATSVTFLVRDPARAATAIHGLRGQFPQSCFDLIPLSAPDAREARRAAIHRARVIINATPIGMAHLPAAESAPVIEDPAWIGRRHCCFDFVYGARETAFLAMARERGAQCLDGVQLLVAQAQGAFRSWTGEEFELAEMLRALRALPRRE